MRILLISFYFPPDIGPGPLRAESIVDALVEAGGQDLEIEVLTTMPNRYRAIASEAPAEERCGSVLIRRIPLPPHRSGMFDQSKAFARFATRVLKQVRGQRYDAVVATSSRLMTQTLGAAVARIVGAKLFLDVRDIFTETIHQVLAGSPLRLATPLFSAIERWSYRQASGVNVVSPAFAPHVRAVRPGLEPSVHTNGIDEVFLSTSFSSPGAPSSTPLVVYAGNIGDGQGLHHVLPAVAQTEGQSIRFRIIGDGGRKPELVQAVMDRGLANVELLEPVQREQLLQHYRDADILFLHLNDLDAFRKVIPSKIFEYAATRKPILAGVSGTAAAFLREQVGGVEVFEPCDREGMHQALARLRAGPKEIDRADFCAKYRRRTVMRRLAEDILSTTRR